jgi:tRNA threonylcarbamoyladenosine biosynthesis protein TsaE
MKPFRFTFNENDLNRIAEQFLTVTKNFKHFAFYGDMGAGKTTFITALCRIMGTLDLASSPTFSIINEYGTKKGDVIYHFDFYRIKSTVELLDIGFYDYCSNDAFCFIEWPDKAEELIPEDFLKIELSVLEDGSRSLTFEL